MNTIIAILHIGTAIFIIGPMAMLPMIAMRALRAGDRRQVRSLAKSTTTFSWLSLSTFILGFGLQGMYEIPITATWIWLSAILYLAAVSISLIFVAPALRRAGDHQGVPDGEPFDDAVPSNGYGMFAATSGITTLLLIITVVLMITKI